MQNLMPHNAEAAEKITDHIAHGKKNILYVSGVGTGKSYVVKYLIENEWAGKKIIYVIPKLSIADYLLNEAGFSEYDNVSFLTYNYFDSKDKALDIFKESDIIICDEAHHLGSDLYGKILTKMMKKKLTLVIGLTATPVRDADRVNISIYFDAQVTGLSNFEAIRKGLMPKFEYIVCTPDILQKAEKEKKVVLDYENSEDFLKDIIKTNQRDKWIAFFPNTKKLNDTRELIERLYPGYHIITLYADLGNTKEALDEIRSYDKCIVLSCNILLEGLHIDSVGGIIMFRDVTSLTVFQQILGRTCQIGKKENPVVIDCTETAVRLMRKLLKEDGERQTASDRTIYTRHHDILNVSLCNKRYYDITSFLYASGQYEEFEFRGKIYHSLFEACKAYSLNRQLVLKRAKAGNQTPAEIMEQMLADGETIKKGTVVYQGIAYPTMSALYKAFGLDPDRARIYRKKTGKSIEETIADKDIAGLAEKNKRKPFVVNGVTYKTKTEFCNKTGVTASAVRYNARKMGISEEESAKNLLRPRIGTGGGRLPFEYKGKVYKTLSACCRQLGVSNKHIREKVHTKGYTYAEAIDETLENKAKAAVDTSFIIFGCRYNSLTQFVRDMKVGKGTVYKLESEGLSRQEALEQIARQKTM